MPEFARGLKLAVTDRDEFDQFISDHAHDPGTQVENWGHNSVPDALYIARYTDDDPSFYKTYDRHVNNELSWNYWSEPLLEQMLDAGILEHTGEYDTDLVNTQDD